MITVRAKPGLADGWLTCGPLKVRCSIGAAGLALQKSEGDRCTPIGTWPLRRVFYRTDRTLAPVTALSVMPIAPIMGWCDDPADVWCYNRLVTLPHRHGHETLWRHDGLYDIIVEIGYNDAPPRPGLGSAIFLHVASPGFEPTAGCVAIAKEDLDRVLTFLSPGDVIEIIPEDADPSHPLR